MKYIIIPLFRLLLYYPYRTLKVIVKFILLLIGFICIFIWTLKFEEYSMWKELYIESILDYKYHHKKFNSILDYILNRNFQEKYR